MKQRRVIAPGELLALDPRSVRQDADAIFFLFSPSAPENEYADGVACVHIRGPLDHHEGFGDNYDAIRHRAQEAFECEDAHTVIFKIDSPGGAVSGLLDTVRAIRLMSEESSKRSIAYIDERSFSAAYALASACDEIVLPRSGLLGSIGVISTMAEQVERDEMLGYRYVTLASGARKTDGHIHVPITEEATAAEWERVYELADQFFELVSQYRGISTRKIRGFEAGLFLGQKAVDVGLADRVSTFDELLAQVTQNGALAQRGTGVPTSSGKATAMRGLRNKLVAQIKDCRLAMAKATKEEKLKLEGKLSGLQAALEAYEKTTERHIEHHKTKESGDEDEDEEGNETDRGDDEEGDEEKDEEDEEDEEARGGKTKTAAKSKSKPAAKAGKSKARYEDEDEEEDEEEARAEEDEEEAKLANIVRRATGKTGVAARGAFAAMQAKARQTDALVSRVTKLERERSDEKRAATIDAALRANRITRREAKTLEKKPQAYVDAYLEARPKALIVGDDGDLAVPAALPTGEARLPEELETMLQTAMAASEGKISREKFLSDYQASNSKLNGRGGPI